MYFMIPTLIPGAGNETLMKLDEDKQIGGLCFQQKSCDDTLVMHPKASCRLLGREPMYKL